MLSLTLVSRLQGQIRLPAEDGRGQELVPVETLEQALHQQQLVIYLLLALVVVCLSATVWMGVLLLRMQFSVERVAEAVRRVDVLGEAFRSVGLQWESGISASLAERSAGILDLGSEMAVTPRRRKGAPLA